MAKVKVKYANPGKNRKARQGKEVTKSVAGESLGIYWGGFLLNTHAPLELTLNRCSHNCFYCFANLNTPDRTGNIKQVMNLLSKLYQTDSKGQWKIQSYPAWLLREGYPVAFSNRIDPLSASNWFQSKPIIELLNELDIPLYFLTRFGKPAHTEELFDLLVRPTAFYSSVTTLKDDVAKKFEPGAPLPSERLAYIKRLTDAGHVVSVGINPIIPGWIDDPEAIVKACKEAGASGAYISKLHLSHFQLKAMPEATQIKAAEAIKYGLNYLRDPEFEELYQGVKQACIDYDLPFYHSQQKEATRYHENIKALYPKTFPLLQDFVNLCHEELEDGDYIFWEDFRAFFVPQLPKQELSLLSHFYSVRSPQKLAPLNLPNRMTYEKALWYIWQHKDTIFCPANVDCFAWAGDVQDRKRNLWINVEDENNMPILVFKPNGTDNSCYTEDHDL